MRGNASKLWKTVWFVIHGLGVGFILAGIMMFSFKVGRSPMLVITIGVGLLALSHIVERKLPRCPRCGSTMIKDGRCGVCDYELDQDS